MFKFSHRSEVILEGVDDRLARVARRALELSPYDFGITCGLRQLEEQRKLVASGASHTMDSRHLPNSQGEAEAIDIVVYVSGSVTWKAGYYRKVAQAFFAAAIELGIQIEWGGLWQSLVDGPHYQLAESK